MNRNRSTALKIVVLASMCIILSRKQTAKVLIRLWMHRLIRLCCSHMQKTGFLMMWLLPVPMAFQYVYMCSYLNFGNFPTIFPSKFLLTLIPILQEKYCIWLEFKSKFKYVSK